VDDAVELNPMGRERLLALAQDPRQSRPQCPCLQGLAEFRLAIFMGTHPLFHPNPTCHILADRLQTCRHCRRRIPHVGRTPRVRTKDTRTDSPLPPSTAFHWHPNNRLTYPLVRVSQNLDYLTHIQVAAPRGHLIRGHLIQDSRIQATRGLEFKGSPVLTTLTLCIARRPCHLQPFQAQHLASRLKVDVGSQIPNTIRPMDLGVTADTDMAHTSQNTKL
jgi:hypothetical protein